MKALIVETFNRTLKNMMYRVFTEQGNYKWYSNVLADLFKKYNNIPHRTIGMKFREVNVSNENLLIRRFNSAIGHNEKRVKRTNLNLVVKFK